MATHSNVLAWRIPGMGEPSGLPSMGSHRVGHDWSDLEAAEYERASLVALLIKNPPAVQEIWFDSRVQKSPGEGKGYPTILGLLWWLRQYIIHLQWETPGFYPLGGKIPWGRAWQPTTLFLPGEFHGQRSLVGYSPWGHKGSGTTGWLNIAQSPRIFLKKLLLQYKNCGIWIRLHIRHV